MLRMGRWIASLGAAAAAYAGAAHGWRDAAGVGLGAGLSWLSFRRWRSVVEGLGSSGRRRSSLWWMARLALIALTAYAIVKLLKVRVVAVLAGLMTAAAAATFELLYQLFLPGE